MLPHAEPQLPAPPPPPQQLGDLPKDVLDKILSGVPTRDVVRTSVLSSPWRHRWESVPGLDIELHDVGARTSAWVSAARFLERCAGPVGRVSIRGVPVRLGHRTDGWVRLVAGKRPRSLSVALTQAVVLRSLFHCDPAALAELELRCCGIPAPPAAFAGFHGLAKFDLDGVYFAGSARQLEAMVAAAAPTLVDLRLQNIVFSVPDDGFAPTGWLSAAVRVGPYRGCLGGWVIQAPNLRRLVLCLWVAVAGLWELGPLPNLECARIFLNDTAEERDYVQMFTAISNVRELHIGNFYVKTQAATINIFGGLLPSFQNLRILRLDGNFHESPTNHLFSLAPFLETIEIKEWY